METIDIRMTTLQMWVDAYPGSSYSCSAEGGVYYAALRAHGREFVGASESMPLAFVRAFSLFRAHEAERKPEAAS